VRDGRVSVIEVRRSPDLNSKWAIFVDGAVPRPDGNPRAYSYYGSKREAEAEAKYKPWESTMRGNGGSVLMRAKDATPAKCTECGKVFRNVDELDDHQEQTGHFNYPVGHPKRKAHDANPMLQKFEARINLREGPREGEQQLFPDDKWRCYISRGGRFVASTVHPTREAAEAHAKKKHAVITTTAHDASLGMTGDYSVQEERRPASPGERFYIVKGYGKVPQGWSFATRTEADRKTAELNSKAQAHDAQTVIEKYKGYEIERGETGAVRVVGLGRRYAQYFNAYTEAKAVEKAKAAIDREVAKPPAQPVKPEDLIISLNDLPRRKKAHDKDGFQVTSIGMHKVAEAKRRDFKLMASSSANEAENLRREGNLERAKKFLQQETKWLTMAARDDETIYKEYKAQAHDAMPYDFVPKAQKSLSWQISDLDEKIRSIEMKYGRSNSKLPGLRKKLKRLLSGKSVANDALSFTTLFWAGIIAALIAKHYGPKETVGMGSYDLNTYQPVKKAWDVGEIHPGSLGVNTTVIKLLRKRLERKGFVYRFPLTAPTNEMIRHMFTKRGAEGDSPELCTLNERSNGYHNITTI
jgi:hypothetical protein